MSIKRVILTSLFCVAMLFAAGKKAEAAFPYDMEQKPVMAASIKSEKVSVYEDVSLKKLLKEVNGSKLNISQAWLDTSVVEKAFTESIQVERNLVSAGFPLILL